MAADTLARLRRLVQLLVALGLCGTAVELVLLGHYEDPLQFVPFGVLALSLAAVAWYLMSGRRRAALAFQLAMVVLIAAGPIGMGLHYRGGMEFKRESDPSIAGVALFRQVMFTQSPPVLAPAYMALLGMIGLASIYKLEDRYDV